MEENNFNLEKMNSRYVSLKNSLGIKRENIKNLDKEISRLEDDIKIIDSIIITRQRASDDDGVKKAREERKNKLDILKNKKQEAELEKEDLVELKEKIDRILDKVKENPEMKEHIEQVLAKRYDRQNKKIQEKLHEVGKEKEEESKKIEAVERINDLVKNHPNMNNNLKGILQNKVEIKKLLAEKQKLESKTNKTQEDIKRISDIENEVKNRNQKVEKNKESMMNYIEKNKIKISEKDIDNLSNYAVVGKDGQVNIDKTLNASIKQYKDNVKKLDNEISKQGKKFNINRQAIINFGQIPTEMQVDNTESRESENDTYREEREDSGNNSESKPKWWQFIKRFKAWNERRQQRALGDGTEEYVAASNMDTKHGEFANSLKYDIVKDIVEKQSKEAQKVAKREYNEAEKNDDEAR